MIIDVRFAAFQILTSIEYRKACLAKFLKTANIKTEVMLGPDRTDITDPCGA